MSYALTCCLSTFLAPSGLQLRIESCEQHLGGNAGAPNGRRCHGLGRQPVFKVVPTELSVPCFGGLITGLAGKRAKQAAVSGFLSVPAPGGRGEGALPSGGCLFYHSMESAAARGSFCGPPLQAGGFVQGPKKSPPPPPPTRCQKTRVEGKLCPGCTKTGEAGKAPKVWACVFCAIFSPDISYHFLTAGDLCALLRESGGGGGVASMS